MENEARNQDPGYRTEADLLDEFKRLMRDEANIEAGANYLFDSLLDEIILGVGFEVHRSIKTGIAVAVEGEPEDNKQFKIGDNPNVDIFGSSNAIKVAYCTCPNCERPVAAARFAPHLEKCMGLGRNSSRIASRRIASNREGSSYFGAALSDDEDDADWSGEKQKRKFQTMRTNGTKKNGKSNG